MQKLIFKETHDKLYFPMIDKIVKFQKLCRRNLLLFRMRKMIHKLVLITRLYKHFDKYEIRQKCPQFLKRIQRMCKKDYFMRLRKIKVDKHQQFIQNRLIQKEECRKLRLTFVAGLLNKFYVKWYGETYFYLKNKDAKIMFKSNDPNELPV